MCGCFERTVEITGNPKDSAHWIMGEVMKLLNDSQTLPEDMHLTRTLWVVSFSCKMATRSAGTALRKCWLPCLQTMWIRTNM